MAAEVRSLWILAAQLKTLSLLQTPVQVELVELGVRLVSGGRFPTKKQLNGFIFRFNG